MAGHFSITAEATNGRPFFALGKATRVVLGREIQVHSDFSVVDVMNCDCAFSCLAGLRGARIGFVELRCHVDRGEDEERDRLREFHQ